MKKFTLIILIISMLMSSGCAFFRKSITNDNLRSTREAAQVQERAKTINNSASNIRVELKDAVKELDAEKKAGIVDPYMYNVKKQRFDRMDDDAKLIERLASLNAASGERIININSGDWYATWWFKGLMIVLGLIVLSAIAGYITFMMKQWGLLRGVKYMNEGLTEAVAALIDKNDSIDNASIYHEGMRKRLDQSGRYRQ
jgi:hypothetical protein